MESQAVGNLSRLYTLTARNIVDLQCLVVISLAAGDTALIYLALGSLYCDDAYQTSFAGFLYQPLNERKVIWAVHQTMN